MMPEEESQQKRILVVEDSPELQALLEMAFELQGYQVFCRSNGKEALDFLRSCADLPQVILLDLMMPIMDGYEFRKSQLLDPKIAAIPVIVMTADEDFSPENHDIQANFYLKKPMELDHLMQMIAKQFS